MKRSNSKNDTSVTGRRVVSRRQKPEKYLKGKKKIVRLCNFLIRDVAIVHWLFVIPNNQKIQHSSDACALSCVFIMKYETKTIFLLTQFSNFMCLRSEVFTLKADNNIEFLFKLLFNVCSCFCYVVHRKELRIGNMIRELFLFLYDVKVLQNQGSREEVIFLTIYKRL